ncbi:MAG: hypothetical protein J4F43_03675 [Dehalococcoidia bacterium]|nr:hypothetical protein [Dehalococcoidia bacterium]
MERPRTRSRATAQVVDLVGDLATLRRIHVSYTTGREHASAILDALDGLVEREHAVESRLGPVPGTHLGPNRVSAAVTRGDVPQGLRVAGRPLRLTPAIGRDEVALDAAGGQHRADYQQPEEERRADHRVHERRDVQPDELHGDAQHRRHRGHLSQGAAHPPLIAGRDDHPGAGRRETRLAGDPPEIVASLHRDGDHRGGGSGRNDRLRQGMGRDQDGAPSRYAGGGAG